MELKEILNFVREFSGGLRHPKDDFYKEGNDDCQPLKPYGLCDFDDEIFYHKPYPYFSCHISGCNRTFDTIIGYATHYNSCHCFTCKECNKNLPNYHLLDLHISETHDFFFLAQAKKKPMYKCFLEECKECFNNPNERKDHCIKVHKFPSDFRFDSAKKITGPKKRRKKNEKTLNKNLGLPEGMEVVESSEGEGKVFNSESESKEIKKKHVEFKGFSFGRSQKNRKPVFYNFSKALMESLPES